MFLLEQRHFWCRMTRRSERAINRRQFSSFNRARQNHNCPESAIYPESRTWSSFKDIEVRYFFLGLFFSFSDTGGKIIEWMSYCWACNLNRCTACCTNIPKRERNQRTFSFSVIDCQPQPDWLHSVTYVHGWEGCVWGKNSLCGPRDEGIFAFSSDIFCEGGNHEQEWGWDLGRERKWNDSLKTVLKIEV